MLDTNVVLDWFVFRDPATRTLAEAIERGHVVWLSCAEMRAELQLVLRHLPLGGRSFDPELVLTSWDRLSRPCRLATVLPPMRMRCSDPKDQMFIDLALAQGARWLLTHDRALLKLARRAGQQGLLIQPPKTWSLADAGPAPTCSAGANRPDEEKGAA